MIAQRIGYDMRRLVFLPLLVLMACTGPNGVALKGGFWGQAANPATLDAKAATPLSAAVIQTQTLAPMGQPAPTASAPLTANQSNPDPATVRATPMPLSPQEADCRAKGGRWGKAGKLVAMTCYIPAKDAGKSCSRQSDCSSQCLARSKTCAPIWPIFGCSDVLQNDGSMVKLCID